MAAEAHRMIAEAVRNLISTKASGSVPVRVEAVRCRKVIFHLGIAA